MQLSVQEVAKSTGPSLPRSGHAAAPLPEWHTHDAIVLGGYTEKAAEDGKMERQEVMEGWLFSKQGGGRWEEVNFAEGSPMPPARLVSQAVLVGENMYLIGGWNPSGPNPFLNDVWHLDLKSYRWQQLQPEGEPLLPISRHQAVAVGSSIYIHTHRSTEDILVLDMAQPLAPKLNKVPVSGDVPSSRGLHSLVAVPPSPGARPDKLLLFGGAPQRGPMMSDLYSLDLQSMVWSRLSPAGPQPHARCAHACSPAPLGRHMVVFGGAFYRDQVAGGGGLQVLGDGFIYDTLENTWVPLSPAAGAAMPAARNAHTLVPISSQKNEFLLHGGWVPFTSTFNDTFLICLE